MSLAAKTPPASPDAEELRSLIEQLGRRLDDAKQELKVDVVVSEDALRSAGDGFIAEPIGETKVRGREQPVRLYRLLGVQSAERSASRAH